MRTIKTLSIFLLTFSIGYLSAPTKQLVTEQREVLKNEPLIAEKTTNIPLPKPETKFKPEIFNVDEDEFFKETKHKTQLIETGENYRGDNIETKSGEKWLGLFQEDDKTVLQFTQLKVKETVEYIPDGKKKYRQVWKTVTVSNKKTPQFLLKNAKGLKEGTVKTLFQYSEDEYDESKQNESLLKQNSVKDFWFYDKKYTFRVKDGLTKSNDKILVLFLESDGISQIVQIAYYYGEGDYVGNLLWVGDLDRDGKLDFYMNFNDYEKGSYRSSLFLSSEADKGKLVKEVASFSLPGC